MRTTSLCVLCVLLAMVCWVETMTAVDKTNHFRSTIKQAMELTKKVKNDTFLSSPTNDIEDCCAQSALQCFSSQLLKIPTTYKTLLRKLNKNLSKSVIVESVGNCSRKERAKVICKSCDSYPMVDNKEFLKNLLSFLQKAFSRLP
ncbi:interleukin-21 isoform X2 [Electrophorus electricus]|uniref:interleukin-21 isoform X2 n=1 Tax=Electrophorus electricus TaxID=8005 RepID=UPI0015D01CC4|nr:interleukin-21 isoform X2 [Electrophorus electricus]